MNATPTAQVGGIGFRVQTLRDAVRDVAKSTTDRVTDTGNHVHFANAYTIALARHDDDYRALLNDRRALVYTDGTPVAWVGKRGYPALAADWERVYGPDFLAAFLTETSHQGLRHYFLGGAPRTLELLIAKVRERWPDTVIAGWHSPPFGEVDQWDLELQDDRIRASGANVVWVGLGTPKQDFEAARLARTLPVTTLGVGAAFDFLAGTKPQAPRWMQRSGSEWLYRLGTEPGRLWKRYLWGNPQFLLAAAKQPGLRRNR